ncbi:hypothetical protein HBH70_220540 [Parastagonospora nodorum]|nr:hypothetical protein HBH53_241540 [Parastagonospora nodorum]KAH3957020.1 hypothetical protein HBH51_231060 [Parastagonospora nodorum]KAH3968566.1 hypothetical protein HBH52_181000 [Parastagonospora nodorum]KAH3991249.1 hypothetical protein HBI10_235150 [Parastagonospora nodorum]KAH4008886.1 hypothetical protein HBI13_227700 [Parastagonospora nodorum]
MKLGRFPRMYVSDPHLGAAAVQAIPKSINPPSNCHNTSAEYINADHAPRGMPSNSVVSDTIREILF